MFTDDPFLFQPDVPSYRLTVNGRRHTVDADERMPLLWVLRDLLSLTGTKFGCGIGACGACSVLIDGTVQRSCMVPVSAIGLRQVTTIEGLSSDVANRLRRAWEEESVPQCGYCQAGQLVAAADLLARNADPTDEEIVAAMRGNLCRCGTYGRILRAVRKAASR